MDTYYSITGRPRRAYADQIRATAPYALQAELDKRAAAVDEGLLDVQEASLELQEDELEQAKKEFEDSIALQNEIASANRKQGDVSTGISTADLGVRAAPQVKKAYQSITGSGYPELATVEPPMELLPEPVSVPTAPGQLSFSGDGTAVRSYTPLKEISPPMDIEPLANVSYDQLSMPTNPRTALRIGGSPYAAMSYPATELGGVAMAGEADVAGLAAAEAAAEGTAAAGMGLQGVSSYLPYVGFALQGYNILDQGFDWSGDSNGPPNLSRQQLLEASEGTPVYYEGQGVPVQNNQIMDPGSGRVFNLSDKNMLDQIRSGYLKEEIGSNMKGRGFGRGNWGREERELFGAPGATSSPSGMSSGGIRAFGKKTADRFYNKARASSPEGKFNWDNDPAFGGLA